MVNCEQGEDTILVCPTTGYAANVEKCEIGERPWSFDHDATDPLETRHTPKMPGIEAVAGHLGTTPSRMLKTLVMQPAADAQTDARWVLVVVRGDHDVNEGKVRDALGFGVMMADEKAAREAGFAIGYVSPRMTTKLDGVTLVIDPDATAGGSWATGSDKPDHHDTGFNWRRDFPGAIAVDRPDKHGSLCSVKLADIRNARAGDPSPRDAGATLEARRGIEVGHIFKLGTKYSKAFDFAVLDRDQKRRDVIMGCYGIGVSRTMAACVEMSHDEHGIVWPVPIAPYHVVIGIVKEDDEIEARVRTIAKGLSDRGVDVLIDDRNERPGVKFKDADLIGIPVRVVIGPKTIEKGGVEVKARTESGFGAIVGFDDVVERVTRLLVERAIRP
jgi:prolyl-tRNA synthetase